MERWIDKERWKRKAAECTRDVSNWSPPPEVKTLWKDVKTTVKREVKTSVGRRAAQATGAKVSGPSLPGLQAVPGGSKGLGVAASTSDGWDVIEQETLARPPRRGDDGRPTVMQAGYFVGGEEGAVSAEDAEYRRTWNLPSAISQAIDATHSVAGSVLPVATEPSSAAEHVAPAPLRGAVPQQPAQPSGWVQHRQEFGSGRRNLAMEAAMQTPLTPNAAAAAAASAPAPAPAAAEAEATAPPSPPPRPPPLQTEAAAHSAAAPASPPGSPGPREASPAPSPAASSPASSYYSSAGEASGSPRDEPSPAAAAAASGGVGGGAAAASPPHRGGGASPGGCRRRAVPSAASEARATSPRAARRKEAPCAQPPLSEPPLSPGGTVDWTAVACLRRPSAAASGGPPSPRGGEGSRGSSARDAPPAPPRQTGALSAAFARVGGAAAIGARFAQHAALGLLHAHDPKLTWHHVFFEHHSRKCFALCAFVNLILFRGGLWVYEAGLPSACRALLGVELVGDWRYELAITLCWGAPIYLVGEIVSTQWQYKMALRLAKQHLRAQERQEDEAAAAAPAAAPTAAAAAAPAAAAEEEGGPMLAITSLIYTRLVYLAFLLQLQFLCSLPWVGVPLTVLLSALLHACVAENSASSARRGVPIDGGHFPPSGTTHSKSRWRRRASRSPSASRCSRRTGTTLSATAACSPASRCGSASTTSSCCARCSTQSTLPTRRTPASRGAPARASPSSSPPSSASTR